MDFSLSEEQEAVRDLAAQILSDYGEHEHLREIESGSDRIDRALWAALARANLLGLPLAERHGGSAMGLTELSILLEAQGRSLVQVPLLATLVTGALPIQAFGSEAQQADLLPGVVSGETILTAALAEAASFDPARPRTTAARDGQGWRLDGEKLCVPAGRHATRILVPARTQPDAIGVFLVDPASPGVSLEAQDVTNHEACDRLVLSGVHVPEASVLGDPEGGAAIVDFVTLRATAGLCAIMLGVAEEALRRTAEYTGVRKQFGRAIGSFQGVSLRAADAYIDVEAMRCTLWQAVWRIDSGLPAPLEVAIAKWWACRGGQRVVHTAQHLHGGTGADVDYPIHRYLLWSKQLDLTLGGASLQLAKIGAQVAAGVGLEAS